MSLPSMQCTRCAVWYPIHGSTTRADVQTLSEDRICPECEGYTEESERRQAKGYQRQPEGTIAGGPEWEAEQARKRAEAAARREADARQRVIREAREQRAAGDPVAIIAKRYGVAESTIRRWTK